MSGANNHTGYLMLSFVQYGRAAVLLAGFSVFGGGDAVASNTFPFSEPFGDNATTTCSSHWKSAKCEAGWSGFGESAALELVEFDGGPNRGTALQPKSGTSGANGIRRTLPLTGSGSSWTLDLRVIATGHRSASADVHWTVEFLNTSNTVVKAYSDHFRVSGVHDQIITKAAPVGAAKVRVSIGANNPNKKWNSSDNRVIIDFAEGDWIDDEIDWCLELVDSCSINIPTVSCPAGYSPYCICDVSGPPACILTRSCWCVENSKTAPSDEEDDDEWVAF